MRSNYKKLGNYIELVSCLNNKLQYGETDVRGVSNNKEIIQTRANNEGRDFNIFYVVKPEEFIYNSRTSRMGDKVGLGYNDTKRTFITSFNNTVFRVKDEALLPMYLYMWFNRPEFDRYVRFHSWGSSTEIFSWEEMCNTLLPVPHIDKQREIVKEYNVIQNRIALNQQLIQKLEETAQAIYKQWFVEGIDLENLPEGWMVKRLSDFCDIKGGKRLPKGSELNDEKDGNPYIKVADMTKDKFVVLNDSFQFVSNDIQKSISRYIVQTGDVIISIVGTIGLVNIVDSTLLNANLTENCYRLANFKVVHSDYLYYYLVSPFGKKEIESRTVGGVQAKLPMYNVQSLPIVLPKKELLQKFERSLSPINDLQNTLTRENHKLSELKDLLLSKLATVSES